MHDAKQRRLTDRHSTVLMLNNLDVGHRSLLGSAQGPEGSITGILVGSRISLTRSLAHSPTRGAGRCAVPKDLFFSASCGGECTSPFSAQLVSVDTSAAVLAVLALELQTMRKEI